MLTVVAQVALTLPFSIHTPKGRDALHLTRPDHGLDLPVVVSGVSCAVNDHICFGFGAVCEGEAFRGKTAYWDAGLDFDSAVDDALGSANL